MRTLADPTLGIEVVSPPASDAGARFPNKWKGYYAHYAALLKADDFLIKCDDDVVFIANLPVLLRVARRDAGAHLLYYPSIVNNDVAASFQAADGILTDPEYVVELHDSAEEGRFSRRPVSDWYNCTACAEHVHSAFLREPARFFTGCIHEWSVAARVPINFFVMGGAAAQKHFAAYANEQFVDEPYLTALLTERTKLSSLMVTDAVVAHFSFGFQHMAEEKQVLERYRQLAKNTALKTKLAADFASRSLSTSCPAAPPAHLLQGRRVLPPPIERPLAKAGGRGGKSTGRGGKGSGRGKGGGAAPRSGATSTD